MESLRVCSKYEIEYGQTTCSHHWHGSLFNAFDILGADPDATDGSDDTYPNDFECYEESYDKAIENLKDMIANPEKMSFNLKCELDALDMTAEELLSYMERFRQEADTHDGYLHFMKF